MNYRSLVVGGTVAAAALSAACMSSTGVSAPRPFSYIDVREIADTAGAIRPYAAAVFIKDRVTGFVPSFALNESCDEPTAIVTDPGTGGGVSSANLEPGTVSMVLKGSLDTARMVPLTMTGITAGGLAQYTNPVRPALHVGDDSIRIDVSGQAGGFPPFSLATPSVAHFVAQPVGDSIVGQGVRVQWTGLPTGTPTRMQISLQYRQGTTGSTPNVEVRCVAYDDGDFTIPRQYVSGWEDAGVDSLHVPHQVVFSRFNTVGANVADGIAVLVARIDTLIVKQ